MSKSTAMKPLALAMGAAFVTSLAGTSVANAAENPFGMTELSGGYMVAEGDMKKEGKCGASHMKEKEGKCGGSDKMKDMDKSKMKEGKCGGGDKMKGMDKSKMKEGKCGGSDKAKGMDKSKMKEGKCGEAKCGGSMKKK